MGGLTAPSVETTFRPGGLLHIGRTLGALQRGTGDPTMRMTADGLLRALRTPDGPATVEVRPAGDGAFAVRAFGPGAAWAAEALPGLLGEGDDPTGFRPQHPVIAGLVRRLPGLRIGRTNRVLEACVIAVLEQRVTGYEAWVSWAQLVRGLGEPAPGPHALWIPPDGRTLAATPYWRYHLFGVDRGRAETIRRIGSVAPRLEECTSMTVAAARSRLAAIRGIGPWTVAQVALAALGDADAVSVGDYHLPHQTAWALAREPRGTDERMLELLAPWPGHRGRVLRLLAAGGIHAPRRGPRLAVRDMRHV